jgi:hypothetical protein
MRDKFFTNSYRVNVYGEGKRAFEEGRPRAYNPYSASKDLGGLWLHGWDIAQAKDHRRGDNAAPPSTDEL